MVVSLLLLAAVIAAVNGKPELPAGPNDHELFEAKRTTTHCRISFEIVYRSAEEEPPYPVCSSRCPRGEEQMWIDGVVFKRLSELKEYNLMVEMNYKNGSLQGCKMVPYETAQESTARQEALSRRMESCSSDAEESQVETIVPSVTELIPIYESIPIHARLEGFTRVGNSLYMVSPNIMTWDAAVKYCDTLGASLASIDSSYEQVRLQEVLKTTVWIGINDIEAEGIFVSAGNTPIKYSNWRAGEPNNVANNEDCVILVGAQQLQWIDVNCNSYKRALCEHNSFNENGDRYWCPQGYWHHKTSCYILSSTADTYMLGEQFCSNNGAYPVFINSQEEHTFLKGISGAQTFVGYSDSIDEGKFIHKRFGIPLFTSWRAGEPNNAFGGEDCAVMESAIQHHWNDHKCEGKYKILCEKAAEIQD